MELLSEDGRGASLGSRDDLARAMIDISNATGGSSGGGAFSRLFGVESDRVLPAEVFSRLGDEAAMFLDAHGARLAAPTRAFLRRLADARTPPSSDAAIGRLIATWDEAIGGFLDGGPAVPDGLQGWFESYAGRGDGRVDVEAMPEPFLGRLDRAPRAAFLALNPGRAFDFQRRDGAFADAVRQAGSFSKWAATWPYIDGDWDREAGRPNRHHRARLAFLRRWLGDEAVPASAMVAFELYPWHSTRVTSAMRPDPEVIRRYIWDPIAALGQPLVFAFGAPWFRMLRDQLGFDVLEHLGAGGRHYGSGVASRSVLVLQGPNDIIVIAEKREGSAGPPSASETELLREAVEARLARP